MFHFSVRVGCYGKYANRLVSQAWREAFVLVEEEEVPQRTPIFGHVGLSPLDTTPITWEYPSEGICVLDNLVGLAPV